MNVTSVPLRAIEGDSRGVDDRVIPSPIAMRENEYIFEKTMIRKMHPTMLCVSPRTTAVD